MKFRLWITAALFALTATNAYAEPVTAAIAVITALWASAPAWVTTLLFSTALYGASLLLQVLTKPGTGPEPGIQFDVQMGDDHPIAFPMGATATAGSRKYIGTWGNEGKTPNAYLTDVIQIADLPAPGQPGLWLNGQKCTILWGDAPAAQGYPVSEFRKSGKDYLWVRYRDGTETVADTYLRDKFGAHEERPWKETMIGRGCPHVIVTALINRELFSSNLTYLVEPPLPVWYDLREDTTAGGSGDQRWDDPATWAATDNPAVLIYNLIRGVYYGDEWLFGGQDLPAFRLPAASWMAAANECDALIDLDGGGTQKQFRAGMEIRGDMEPLAAIDELRKACAGRLAEVGGIFKLLVGAPGSAVYSFTDGDILVTKGQSYTPFPTFDDTHNGIEATYPEPDEMWASKDAPARYSSTLEAEDGDRRLASGVNFAAVPYGVQVQQLMRTMIEEERRFRAHSFYLPPDAYALDPNDVVSWTSTRNGYTNKKFLVSAIKGERTTNQLVVLKEIDPSDYSWSSDFELPTDKGPIGIIHPPAQPMSGWLALAATIEDSSGTGRRPSIEVRYDGDQDDVRAVRIQVRLASSAEIIFDGEQPYGAPADGTKSVILNGVFLPNTAYQARGIFVPFSGRATEWSIWLSVTTPDARLTKDDLGEGAVDLTKLTEEVSDILGKGSSAFEQALKLRRAISPVPAIRELSAGDFVVPIHQLLDDAADVSILTLLRLQSIEGKLRDAGIEIDRDIGRVKIWALDQFRDEVHTYQSSVAITLDALASSINLRATLSDVVNLISTAGLGYVEAYGYNFNGSADGWTGQNATLTTGATALSVVATAPGGFAKITGLSLDSGDNTIVQITVKRTAGTGWGLKLYWGASFEYSLAFETPSDPTVNNTLVLSLDGATGWSGTLTQLGVGAADGVTFAIDVFTVGASSFQQLALAGLTGRISSAEINISALQSAINAKVELAVFNGLSTTVTTVQADLSALTGTVALKATQVQVDALSASVTHAQLTLDALNALGVFQVDKTRETAQDADFGDLLILALLNGQRQRDHVETSFGRVRQELSVKIDDQGNVLSERIDSVIAITNTNIAAIVTEQMARTTADSALATSITTLLSTVVGHTASITSINSTLATIDGKLSATAGLLLDVDGYITGWQAYNDGSTSSFAVVADNFLVAFPGVSGGDPVNVFAVANVNGIAKVALRGDMLIDGTVYARHVVTGETYREVVTAFSNVTNMANDNSFHDVATGSIVAKSGKLNVRIRTPGFSSLATASGASQNSAQLRIVYGSGGSFGSTAFTLKFYGYYVNSNNSYELTAYVDYTHEISGLTPGVTYDFKLQYQQSGGGTIGTMLAGAVVLSDPVNAYI